MFVAIILCSLIPLSVSTSITVFGDVFRDREFFVSTFPWIVDNIGGEIEVDFQLVGSGRYSIPQMCALEEMRMNTYLQAQYLKCEAEGNPSAYCLCETGIDSENFKECVNQGGHLASQAARRFTKLNIGATPLIELYSGSTVFGVTNHWYLKKICTIFGEPAPMGCIKPFQCCQNSTEPFIAKKALAQFDKECSRGNHDFVYEQTTTSSVATAE